jgi:hypothetical protein
VVAQLVDVDAVDDAVVGAPDDRDVTALADIPEVVEEAGPGAARW